MISSASATAQPPRGIAPPSKMCYNVREAYITSFRPSREALVFASQKYGQNSKRIYARMYARRTLRVFALRARRSFLLCKNTAKTQSGFMLECTRGVHYEFSPFARSARFCFAKIRRKLKADLCYNVREAYIASFRPSREALVFALQKSGQNSKRICVAIRHSHPKLFYFRKERNYGE